MSKFDNLNRLILSNWAGDTITARGADYQHQGAVEDFRITPEGDLLAWVNGSRRYAVLVYFDNNGELQSECACTCDFTCKHAVAVILDYLVKTRQNLPVPSASTDDKRLRLLNIMDDDHDPETDDTSASNGGALDIEPILKSMTKSQLTQFVVEMAWRNPEIAEELKDRQSLKTGNSKALIGRLRREIRHIADSREWQSDWEETRFDVDFGKLYRKLQALLEAGEADELLALGSELIQALTDVIEAGAEEEIDSDAYNCVNVIAQALDHSSLPQVDKMMRAFEAITADGFDLCDTFSDYLHREHPATDWSVMADRLLERLKKLPVPVSGNDYHRSDERDRLSDWIIHALERCEREAEVIPLCEKEAGKTGSYLRLITKLIEAKRYGDAERWINKRMESVDKPGAESRAVLRSKMLEIRRLEENWQAVAALKAEGFTGSPSISAFKECRAACEKVNVWQQVRAYLLTYLEKASLPWK